MKSRRRLELKIATVLIASIAVLFGCSYRIPPVVALDTEGKISTNVATLLNSSQQEFMFYTALHGGDGILQKQEGGASIALGEHTYQVLVTRRSKLAILILQDIFYRDAVCAFSLNARPGYSYTLGDVTNSDKVMDGRAIMYRAKLQLVEQESAKPPSEMAVDAECTSTKNLKGEFVPPSSWWNFQLDTLCKQHGTCGRVGEVCRTDPGFRFGVCVSQ